MKTQPIGTTGIVSTRLAYGCWRVVGTWDPAEVTAERRSQARQAIIAAYEAGYRLFDHADIYCRGVCEDVFGQTLREVRGMREAIIVATKCGIRFAGDSKPDAPYRYDFSADYITWSCEQSLKRLGVDVIDIYQLHRPDYLMNPHEVASAFEKLRRDGKVREFGVSNFKPSQVTSLQRCLPMRLAVNQVQISLADPHCFEDGTLDQCIADQITPMAWSPLGGGLLAKLRLGATQPRRRTLVRLLRIMDKIAAAYGTTRVAIALAWLLKHPSHIIPIVGSAKSENIQRAARADDIELTREDWYRLMAAARDEPLP